MELFSPLDPVNRRIVGDPKQPGRKASLTSKGLKTFKGLKENLLGKIRRVLRMVKKAHTQAINTPLVPLDEESKKFLLPKDDLFDDPLVVDVAGFYHDGRWSRETP